MSGPDNTSPFPPNIAYPAGSGPAQGPALPPPSAPGSVTPPTNQPGFNQFDPYGGPGPAGASNPAGPTSGSGGGGGVPIVVWFLLGLFLVGGAIGVYFLARGDDAAQQPSATAIPTLPTTPPVPASDITQPAGGDDEVTPAQTAAPAVTTTVATTTAPATTEPPPTTPATTPATTAPVATDSAAPDSSAVDPGPADSAAPSPAAAPDPSVASLPDGTYTVGTDIAPGAYRVGFELEGDYDVYSWTIFDSNDFLNDIEVGIGGWGLMVVPDDPGATVEIEGGALPIEATGPVDPNDYENGTYIVGYDIEPGTYELSGDHVAFTRYDAEMSSIASGSAGATETLELTVKPTDYAVAIEGQLTKLG